MPKSSRTEATEHVVDGDIEAHLSELDGGYTVSFESYGSEADPGELFRGLPDDRCQAPHWGYVVTGSLTYRFADHDETFRAGEAYYVPPGHLPLFHAGTEIVEWSPTDLLRETVAVIEQNLAAAV